MTGLRSFASDIEEFDPVSEGLQLDSFTDAGVLVSVELVNGLAVGCAPHGSTTRQTIAHALAVDPQSVAQLRVADASGFIALSRQLQLVFQPLNEGRVDRAALQLNRLLAACPAHPHLEREHGAWRLHHHPVDAALVPMWTAICAEGLARMIGTGHADRLGTCSSDDCERVYVDLSKNSSRRFCSTTCQNRVKAAAFRRRRAIDVT